MIASPHVIDLRLQSKRTVGTGGIVAIALEDAHSSKNWPDIPDVRPVVI